MSRIRTKLYTEIITDLEAKVALTEGVVEKARKEYDEVRNQLVALRTALNTIKLKQAKEKTENEQRNASKRTSLSTSRPKAGALPPGTRFAEQGTA